MICFHFTIFVVLETTPDWRKGGTWQLWFAFILLSLSYWKQRSTSTRKRTTVVICFHFTIFVVLETTATVGGLVVAGLWFAFILLSLSYWKQRGSEQDHRINRCDLLSFYYLCRTGNNGYGGNEYLCWVVICFHFTIFVVLETTCWRCWRCCAALWFAFILLSLSYWKQPLVGVR